MKRHARLLLLILSALGLAASVSSLYVHYQMLQDPSYQSFCDVSATVSCEAVLESRFSTLFGVPVASGGAIWSALVFLLALFGMRPANARPASGDAAGYIFVLGTLGLAVVLYLGYASFFIIQRACPLCIAMYVAVVGVFLVSGAAASSELSKLPSRLGADLSGMFRRPLPAVVGVLWLVASASLVAFFPRSGAAPVNTATAAAPVLMTETLTDDQRAQFETWIVEQPRAPLPVASEGAAVLVLKFNDYQCPSCRRAYLEYRDIVAKYEREQGSRVKFLTMDFPLEAECNTATIHLAACEAAAAVRAARAKGRGAAMEAWLFSNQEQLTPERVKEGLEEVAQVSAADFDAQYPTLLDAVRADVKVGRELNVTGTPTFFVNGIKVPMLRPVYFDALIASELKRAETKTD